MTISRVQLPASGTYDQATGNPTTVSCNWTTPTVEGNTLVAWLGISLVAGGSSAYSAPAGWVEIERADNATNCAEAIYVIENAASRSGAETFTIAGVARDTTLTIAEYASDTGSIEVDAFSGDATGNDTSPATGAAAPVVLGDLLRVACIANRNANTQSAPTNGFTEIREITSANATAGNRVNCGCYELIHNSSASITCGATISSTRPWAASQVVLREIVVATDPPVAVVTDAPNWLVDATASTTGDGGTLAYAIDQDSGPVTTEVEHASGVWSIPQGASQTIWTVTVTESPSGLTDTHEVTVPAAGDAVGPSLGTKIWNGSAWVP